MLFVHFVFFEKIMFNYFLINNTFLIKKSNFVIIYYLNHLNLCYFLTKHKKSLDKLHKNKKKYVQ